MKIKHIILSIFVASIFGPAHARSAIYLENQSRREIVYHVNNRQVEHLPHGIRRFLGTITLQKDPKTGNPLPLALVNSISIQAADAWAAYGYGSWTESLEGYLNQIRTRNTYNCNMTADLCSKNAVIVINPSGMTGKWNVDVQWETPWKAEEFEMDQFK